jgi:hypothetical protein
MSAGRGLSVTEKGVIARAVVDCFEIWQIEAFGQRKYARMIAAAPSWNLAEFFIFDRPDERSDDCPTAQRWNADCRWQTPHSRQRISLK